MFVLCPHCQFLVELDPRTGAPPAVCPKCGKPIAEAGPPEAPAGSTAPGDTATAKHARRPRSRKPPAVPAVDAGDAPITTSPATTRPPTPAPGPTALPSASTVSAPATGAPADVGSPPPANAAPTDRLPPTALAAQPVPRPVVAATVPPADEDPPSGRMADQATPPGNHDGDAGAGVGAPSPPTDAGAPADESGRTQAPLATVATGVDPAAPPAGDTADPANVVVEADADVVALADTGRDAPAADIGAPMAAAPASADTPSHPARNAPSFLHPPRIASPTPLRARALAWTSIAGLTVVLALQVVLADRAHLAADARWRPLVTSLCGVFGCSVPAWREPAAFTMLSRDVRPHPGVAGTLRVSATFRNDARWPQPWPVLLLTLSDLDGRTAGARAFVAADYVDPTAAQQLLMPGQSATVTLDVVEPAPRIVAFTFDFR